MSGEQLVKIGNDVVAFPAGMSDAQIEAVIKSQGEVPDRSLFQSGGMAVKQAVPSTIKGLTSMVSGVLTPVETAKSVGQLVTGELQKVLPNQAVNAINEFSPEFAKKSEMTANAFNQDLNQAYGSWPRIKNTLATDPFRLAADLSVVGGSAGVAAKSAKATKLGETLSKLSGDVNPVGAVTKSLAKGSEFFGEKASSLANKKAINATRDATIKQSLDAGYTIPRSAYNPSKTTNVIESAGGKAAINQEAAKLNQAKTDELARKYLDIPEDTAFSEQLIEELLQSRAQPYAEVKKLPIAQVPTSKGGMIGSKQTRSGAEILDELKTTKDISRANWKAVNNGTSPNVNETIKAANEADIKVAKLETEIEDLAKVHNQPELLNQLKQSRKELAKIYTIEKAMNPATGEINAANIKQQYNKNVPLTDEAKIIADFNNSFGQLSREGSKVPNPDVSQTKALASMISGGSGGGFGGLIGGAPGAAIGALLGAATPFVVPPVAKALALSKMLQKQKTYKPGSLQSLPKANKAALGLYQMNQANQGEQ
jgi:hypothetical protein